MYLKSKITHGVTHCDSTHSSITLRISWTARNKHKQPSAPILPNEKKEILWVGS